MGGKIIQIFVCQTNNTRKSVLIISVNLPNVDFEFEMIRRNKRHQVFQSNIGISDTFIIFFTFVSMEFCTVLQFDYIVTIYFMLTVQRPF